MKSAKTGSNNLKKATSQNIIPKANPIVKKPTTVAKGPVVKNKTSQQKPTIKVQGVEEKKEPENEMKKQTEFGMKSTIDIKIIEKDPRGAAFRESSMIGNQSKEERKASDRETLKTDIGEFGKEGIRLMKEGIYPVAKSKLSFALQCSKQLLERKISFFERFKNILTTFLGVYAIFFKYQCNSD